MKNNFLIITFCFTSFLFADIHYVNITNPFPIEPFTNWVTASTCIQDAVEIAAPSDIVLVTNGVYSCGGSITPGYVCSNRVVVTQDIKLVSVNGPDATVILGAPAQTGSIGHKATRGVYMSAGIISGFTISNGYTYSNGDSHHDLSGGGVNARHGGIITNCIISGNYAMDAGGGIFFGTVKQCVIKENWAFKNGGGLSKSVVNNCIICKNSSDNGGGLSYCVANNCVISENTAYWSGGGASGGTLNNCEINGNSAGHISSADGAGRGGGAYESTINNSAIFGNISGAIGGGIYDGIANNCTISGNSAVLLGGGTCKSEVNNSIIYYNSAPQYSNIYNTVCNFCCTELYQSGIANIVANPKLVNRTHIAPSSPCASFGASQYASGVDIDGDTWKHPPSIGCDQYNADSVTGILSVVIAIDYTNISVGYNLDFNAIIKGRAYAHTWSFDDGSVVSNSFYMSHVWQSPGNYKIVLSAYNYTYPSGVSSTVTIHVIETPIHYVNCLNIGGAIVPYSNWGSAAIAIQDAIDVATIPGSRVVVTNGIYASGGGVASGQTSSNRVMILDPIIVESLNGPNNTTILGASDPITGTHGENSVRGVYMRTGELKGFTISNGYTSTPIILMIETRGGGVNAWKGGFVSNCIVCVNFAYDGGGVAYGTFVDCVIRGNSADNDGGGAYASILYSGSIVSNTSNNVGGGTYLSILNRTIIDANSARRGGGTYISTLNDCFIINNIVTEYGGGLCNSVAKQCLIESNVSGTSGGGATDSEVVSSIIRNNLANIRGGGTENCEVDNCLIIGNSAQNGGGTFSSTLNGCTIVKNLAQLNGGGIYFGDAKNSIIYYNAASNCANIYQSGCQYCCIELDYAGLGNISDLPYFVDTNLANYRLVNTSPCINAGTNEFAAVDWDLDGNPRIVYERVDIGAYEYFEALGCYFSATPNELVIGNKADFIGYIAGTNTEEIYYSWDFENDGFFDIESSALNTISNTYDIAGTYSVLLMVSNGVGEVATSLRTDYIVIIPEPLLSNAVVIWMFSIFYMLKNKCFLV